MTDVSIEPATRAHAEELEPLLRPEDRAEVSAMVDGLTTLEALAQSVAASETACAVRFDGELAALFGVALEDSALPPVVWLMTGKAVTRHPKAFLKASRSAVSLLLARYPLMGNLIDARYSAALRWAKWLGLELGAPIVFGPERREFIPFTLRRTQWESPSPSPA